MNSSPRRRLLAYFARRPAAGSWALLTPGLLWLALFFAAPFVGLAYVIALPFVGMGMLAWMGVKAAVKRANAG